MPRFIDVGPVFSESRGFEMLIPHGRTDGRLHEFLQPGKFPPSFPLHLSPPLYSPSTPPRLPSLLLRQFTQEESSVAETARCFISLNIKLSHSRSIKVIETGTTWKHGYGFLLAIYSNYDSILYRFRDKARYWSKIAIFSYPLHSTSPLGSPRLCIIIPFGIDKLKWCGYPNVKKFEDIFIVAVSIEYRRVTDKHTDRQADIVRQHSPCLCIASRGSKQNIVKSKQSRRGFVQRILSNSL